MNLPGRIVESSLLAATVDGELVGRVSLRHRLNDFLAHEGGHVGYAVHQRFRGRGYATEMLRQSVIVLRSLGVDRVLVTCDDDNVASVTVIERCGGVLESIITAGDGEPKRRYWID